MYHLIAALPVVCGVLGWVLFVYFVTRPRPLQSERSRAPSVTANIRLAFAVFWAALGAGLLLRQHLFSSEMFSNFEPTQLNFGGMLALVLAAYNVLRWLVAYRRVSRQTTPRNPLAPRERPRPSEYNPELDFTKRDQT